MSEVSAASQSSAASFAAMGGAFSGSGLGGVGGLGDTAKPGRATNTPEAGLSPTSSSPIQDVMPGAVSAANGLNLGFDDIVAGMGAMGRSGQLDTLTGMAQGLAGLARNAMGANNPEMLSQLENGFNTFQNMMRGAGMGPAMAQTGQAMGFSFTQESRLELTLTIGKSGSGNDKLAEALKKLVELMEALEKLMRALNGDKSPAPASRPSSGLEGLLGGQGRGQSMEMTLEISMSSMTQMSMATFQGINPGLSLSAPNAAQAGDMAGALGSALASGGASMSQGSGTAALRGSQ